MLTGHSPFGGTTISDTLAAVLKTDVDIAPVPEPIRPVVERCLRKDPRRRWQAIGDVRLALEEGAPAEPVVERRASKLPWIVAVVLLMALAALSVVHFRGPSEPSYQTSLLPPEKAAFTPILVNVGGFAV